jgi:RNA polymerase sporulation-specific sigma factor
MKAQRTREALSFKLGREPTIKELADQLNLDTAETAQALEASLMPLSLTIDDDGEDVQSDIPVECSEESLIDKLALKDAIGCLNAGDRKLIVMRYFQSKTQSETAKALKMTQVQVSRREKKILAQLKSRLTG